MPTPADMHSLPTELLREIFSLTCSVYTSNVLTLCAVNRRWREIAISYPFLWCRILINVGAQRPAVPLLDLWATRSANSPFDVEINDEIHARHLTHYGRRYSNKFFELALNVLLPYAHNWRSFVIFTRERYSVQTVPSGALVSLERAATLERVVLYAEKEARVYIPLIATLPALKHLEWRLNYRGALPDINKDIIINCFHQLVHLTLALYGHDYHQILDGVRHCTGLVTMVLEYPPRFMGHDSPLPITLPHLRVFSLYSDTESLGLLSIIDCPELNVFSLKINGDSADITYYSHLLVFLAGSHHAIQVLQIHNTFRPEVLVMLFEFCQAASIPVVDYVRTSSMNYSDINQELQERGNRQLVSYAYHEDCREGQLVKYHYGWANVSRASEFLGGCDISDLDRCKIEPMWNLLARG